MNENSLLPGSENSLKKYPNHKKADGYQVNNKNSVWMYIIDGLITLIIAATLCYVYLVNDNLILKYLGYGVSVVFGAFVTVRLLTIAKLVLVGENGKNIKTWNIEGKVSLLIGRNTKNNEVDIDLSNVEYSELISRQHAILNYADGRWYIEDVGSAHGTGLKRINEEKFRLEVERSYELKHGDIIFIANTKIMVK